MFDVALSMVFGGFGYVLRKLKFEAASLTMPLPSLHFLRNDTQKGGT